MLESSLYLEQKLNKLFKTCFMVDDLFSQRRMISSIASNVQDWENFIEDHDCLPQAMQVAGHIFKQIKDKIESGWPTYTPSLYLFLYAFKYNQHETALLLLSLVNFLDMNYTQDHDFYNSAQLIMLLKKMFNEIPDDIKYSPSGLKVICSYIKKMLRDLQPGFVNEMMYSLPLYKIIKPQLGLSPQDCEAILKNLRPIEKAEDNNNTLFADNLSAMVMMGAQIPLIIDKKGCTVPIIPNQQQYQELQRKLAYLLVSHFVKFNRLPYDIKTKVLSAVLPVLANMNKEVVNIIIEAIKNEPQVAQENASAFAEQRRYVAILGYHSFLAQNGCPADLQKTAVQFNRRLIDSRLQFFQSQRSLPLNLSASLRQQLVANIGAEIDTGPHQHQAVTFKQKVVDEGIKRAIGRP